MVETTEACGEEEIEALSPLFIIASLANKVDERTALVRSQRQNRECSLVCLRRHGSIRTSPSVAFRLLVAARIEPRAVMLKELNEVKEGDSVRIKNQLCNPHHIITTKEMMCWADGEL